MTLKNIALIGCGAAAEKYYVPALLKNQKKFKKIYFVDINLEQAKNVASSFQSYDVVDDYMGIVNEIDAAIIAVPHHLHYKIAKFLLEHKKSILCEKPLVEKPDEASEIIQLAAKNKKHVCVNNTRRIFPVFQKIKEIIDLNRKDLLEIQYFEANKFAWESVTHFYVDPRVGPKGILLDLGSHALDLICWWLNGLPDLLEYKDDSYGGPESLSILKASYEDVKIDILLNRLLDIGSSIQIKFKDFMVVAELSEWKQIVYVYKNGNTKKKSIPTKFKKYSEMVNAIILNFINVIYGKETPLISASEVYNSLVLIDKSYQSRKRIELSWNENLERMLYEK